MNNKFEVLLYRKFGRQAWEEFASSLTVTVIYQRDIVWTLCWETAQPRPCHRHMWIRVRCKDLVLNTSSLASFRV